MWKPLSHEEGPIPNRQLPVVLAPVVDELLSSWIDRHAAFYGVPPIIMLQHCLPTAGSLRAIDLHLNDEQAVRLSHMFRMEPKAIRSMSFATVSQSTRRMLAAEPIQFCPACTGSDCGTIRAGTRRSQLQGWRLTCPLCAGRLLDKSETHGPSPLCRYWNQALNGQRLFETESEEGVQSWANPSEIARLLLMRRIPRNISQDTCLERFRVLGAVCLRIPTKPASDSEQSPATHSDFIPAGIPI